MDRASRGAHLYQRGHFDRRDVVSDLPKDPDLGPVLAVIGDLADVELLVAARYAESDKGFGLGEILVWLELE